MANAPSIYSVSQILDAAKLAGGYAAIDRKFCQRTYLEFPDKYLPEKIEFVRKRVQYRYDKNPTDSTLRNTANLLWSLLGKYGLRAINSLQQGGVVVTPSNNIGSYLIQLKNYPQFIVGAVGSPMVNNQDTLIIADPLVVPQSLQGEVEIHVEGAEQGEDLSDRLSFEATYSTGQYTIVWNEGLQDDMLVQIKYPIRLNLIYQANSGTSAGLQATYVTATVTSNILTVIQLGIFVFAQVRGATYDTSVITQTGQNLDFTNVGGAVLGESYLIFYYP
jgi:hypothetical protein